MRTVTKLLLPMAVALAMAGVPSTAQADTVWLCKPGQSNDPCRSSLKTTIFSFGKPKKVVNPKLPPSSAFDCFYVYPTVSGQKTPVANLNIDPEEISIAQYQASRFSQVCDVYAPMYRQVTLMALFAGGATPQDRENAFADVRDAWREYRAANPDRPYILIGHSQGSGMLKRLIAEEIEPNETVRKQMVSALITGSSVAVPKGKTVGGDFKNVPICTKAGQINCVISFATFGQKPPKNTYFGKPRTTGLPSGVTYEAACTNPASLANKKYVKLDSMLRDKPFAGLLGAAAGVMFGGTPPTAKTPWLTPKDRYKAKCVRSNGAHVLMVKPIGQSRKLKPAPSASWGLHLVDINLPLGNLIDLVRQQQRTYSAS